MTNNEYCIVTTTYADDKIGKNIIDSLLKKHLAACVQVQNVQSYYHWNNNISCDNEKLLFIKTKKSLYKKVEEDILFNHDYETPEIVMSSIETGFSAYLNWIEKECIN